MFLIGVIVIALIPIFVIFLLPELSKPIKQRRESVHLISFVIFVWCLSLYIVFTVGMGGSSKSIHFFFGLPCALTYVLFFKKSGSDTKMQSHESENDESTSPQ